MGISTLCICSGNSKKYFKQEERSSLSCRKRKAIVFSGFLLLTLVRYSKVLDEDWLQVMIGQEQNKTKLFCGN